MHGNIGLNIISYQFYVPLQIAFQYTFDIQIQTACTHMDWVWREYRICKQCKLHHTVSGQDQIVMAWIDMGHHDTLVYDALHILKPIIVIQKNVKYHYSRYFC